MNLTENEKKKVCYAESTYHAIVLSNIDMIKRMSYMSELNDRISIIIAVNS